MPVLRPKQSERFAATLNSPPLTWIAQSVALRKGMIPGSSRWTSAPSDRKSSSPSLRIVSALLMVLSLLRGQTKPDQNTTSAHELFHILDHLVRCPVVAGIP